MINTKKSRQDVNGVFSYDLKNIDRLYCTYYHSVDYEDGKRIMYVGSCLFKQVLFAPDARQNKAWREYISSLENIELTIVATFLHPHEAFNELAKIVRENRPYCNVHGERDSSSTRIRCLTDGLEYRNAASACRHYGISQSTMSNHLNDRVGYKTVRGLLFERF